jgi:hypothetical protein
MSALDLRSDCGHVAAAGERCRCGHGAELHDLARDRITRKGCSVSVGPKALHCPCNHFEIEAEVSA